MQYIDKMFGNIENERKRIFHSPESINNISKNEKKSSMRKKISFQKIDNELNISRYSIENENINKNKNNKDNIFYEEFMKKIKEDSKELVSPTRVNRKNKHIQMKPGLIKKEKSQKHIVEKKKDILKNNNSLMFQEGENEEMYLSPKHKTKVNRKINFIEAHNMKQRNSKTSLNHNFFQSQNLINLINEKSSVQNTIFSKKNMGSINENEIQNSVQLNILNNFKKFKILEIENSISFIQTAKKDVNFSNVKKLNLNLNKNNYNTDNKSTINVNQEFIYPSSKHTLEKKKNSILCCI